MELCAYKKHEERGSEKEKERERENFLFHSEAMFIRQSKLEHVCYIEGQSVCHKGRSQQCTSDTAIHPLVTPKRPGDRPPAGRALMGYVPQ